MVCTNMTLLNFVIVLMCRHHRVSNGYVSLDYDKYAIHTINEDAICEEDCKTHGTTLL